MSSTHPAPIVARRTARRDEMPLNARKLADLAMEHGWETWVTYALGTSMPNKAHPDGELVSSIAVRMRRDSTRMVAVWVEGRFVFGGEPWRKMPLGLIRKALAR